MSTATLSVNAWGLSEKSKIRKKQLEKVHDTIANQPNDSDGRRKDASKAFETMEYTFLMEKSQKAAIAVNVKIQDLLDLFLPDAESNTSAGKIEIKLNDYIAELEEFAKTAFDGANRFLRLREAVVNVKEQLEKLNVDIQSFAGEICGLKEGLVNVHKLTASTGNADDDDEQADNKMVHALNYARYFKSNGWLRSREEILDPNPSLA
ncbi:hypothetical protein GALMADRAFT_1353212 [Galerina marginata CBS 339.88]|uniref:Uncharacterized protein n=1 Tax=Galerina marginata (strain CBS 339.88) TaxID=685588 RepID=A0A067SFQ4_GALM3|nr:hypothetical protein GALMADRAFT_1353212 [Galerina marginata CBS 339.88]